MATGEKICFNTENIAEIIFNGFSDEQEEQFQLMYAEVMKTEEAKKCHVVKCND